MAQASMGVQADIHGNISGQVGIGNYVFQVGDKFGGIINIALPGRQPVFKPCPSPVLVRPRPFPVFLDRDTELKSTEKSILLADPVLLYSEAGFGKTSLLRCLSYSVSIPVSFSGLVNFSAHGKSVNDLIQVIFDFFFKDEGGPELAGFTGLSVSKPTDAQIHELLATLKAIILLDDIDLSFDEITELINAAPQCSFVFTSSGRCLWGEGCCIQIHGLPQDEAGILFERELQRQLSENERREFTRLYQLVEGRPIDLLMAAMQVQQGRSIKELADYFQVSENTFIQSVFSKLTDTQKKIISILAAAGSVPIPHKHLVALFKNENITSQLGHLLNLHLVNTHSPTYSLSDPLLEMFEHSGNLGNWKQYLLSYYVDWIARPLTLAEITNSQDLLLTMIEYARNTHHWKELLVLARGCEKTFILNRQWTVGPGLIFYD